MSSFRFLRLLACAGVFAAGAIAAQAEPLRPASDDEIVETLPTLGGFAREQREMRRRLAQQPRNAATALALSRSTLARARIEGDARLAGQALGVLGAWDGDADAPVEIRLQRATVRQHLHEFDAAVKELEAVLRAAPRHPQALLTLATIHRVQGRYGESDAACERLAGAGQPLYARACLAENQALRGEVAAARSEFEALLQNQPGNAGWTSWIRTSLGELEQRAGRPDAAIAQFRAAQQADANPYSRLALVDVLIEAERWPEAQTLLTDAGDSEATLLRRAIVERALGSDEAAGLERTLAARYEQAALRPEAASVHARERARFALEVEGEPERALVLARANLGTQREAIDFVVMHRAAVAAGDAAAQAEVAALAEHIGLHDARLSTKASAS